MRVALALVALLVLPLVGAEPDRTEVHDLLVQLAPGADPAPVLALAASGVAIEVVPAVVVLDAPAALEARLRAAPGVLRVDRAVPLEGHANLDHRLVRAERNPEGLGELAFTGRGVTVAVVDSGIDTTHPDLAGRVKANVRLAGARFLDTPGDPTGHGTHVAGIVAASGATSEGRHRGVAPEAELVGIDISERFTTASALLAYDWLFVQHDRLGIDVVVNAWGRAGAREPFDPEDAVARAIDRLVERGMVVLFSASNHGPAASSLSLEAQHPRVVTVGATDAASLLQPYSSRGPVRLADGEATWIKPDVVAPGEGVTSLRSLQSLPDERDTGPFHRTLSGTSQAVPLVAGVVALMLEADPGLSPAGVQNALREAAIDLAGPGPDDATGFGLLDARDSLRRALGETPDRGNVLVAGGLDRTRGAATLQPAAPSGLLGLASGAADLWTMPFPVKPGAVHLAFDLESSPTGSPLSVTLEHGGRVHGPWTEAETDGRASAVRGRLDAPQPGMWTLRVRGATPVQLDARADVAVLLAPNATRALELDSRYKLPEEASAPRTILHGLEVLLVEARLLARAHPWAPAVLAAGLLLALVGRSVRGRGRV